MRIIAGNLGGLAFSSPTGHRTHPMSNKVRGGLFNVLGDVSGLEVLDVFSGSGALSFEAVSRGAKSSLAIDIDKNSQKVIQENIVRLRLEDKVKVTKAPFISWSNRNEDQVFDLVLADPPYT